MSISRETGSSPSFCKRRHPKQTPASETNACLSPNGKWLAYLSDESGRPGVYVTAFPGPGGKWPVSKAGVDTGSLPSWSADGKELYFVASAKIMSVSIENTDSFQFGKAQPLPMSTADIFGFTPAPTPGRFLVLRRAGTPVASPIHVILNWVETLKK